MSRLKTVLKDRSGQGTPMILAVVVCCLILACVVFEYMRLMIVAQGVRPAGRVFGRLPALRFVLDAECDHRECI